MSLLEELVGAEAAGSYFIRKVAGYRAQKAKQKAKDYQFYGSIAVSDIVSLYDCPQKIIENKKNKSWYAKKSLATMMDEGTEIHKAYQETAKEVPGLQAPDPDNIDPHLMEIYKERGELPVRLYSKCGQKLVSGYLDFVQLCRGMVSPVELKSTNVSEEDFKVRFEKTVLAPNKKHLTQLKTYIYLIKRNKYWTNLKVHRGELVYICVRIMSGEEGRERSVWVELTPEEEKMYDLFFEEVERQLISCPESPAPECKYKHCRDHGVKKDADS